jgi:hypothetical protein
MYPSTEDLLKIRDGEPVDATVSAAVDASPALAAEVERLRRAQGALRGLPAFEPPPGVWERIRADAELQSPAAMRWRWPLRGVIAASVAVLAIALLARFPPSGGDPVADLQPSVVPSTTVGGSGSVRPLTTPAYASLVAESARLERALNDITYRPRLVNVGTATTISDLQDRIAVIDERLMYAAAYALQPRQTEALWRQRVDLMNALVKVRYAQAQRFGF